MENKNTDDIKNVLELLYDGNVKEHENLYIAYDKTEDNYTIYVKEQEDTIINKIKGIGIVKQEGKTYYIVVESITNPYEEAKLLFELMGNAFRSMLGSFDNGLFNSYLDTNKTDCKYKIFNDKFEVIDDCIVSSHDASSIQKVICSVNDVEYTFVIKDGLLIEYKNFDTLA